MDDYVWLGHADPRARQVGVALGGIGFLYHSDLTSYITPQPEVSNHQRMWIKVDGLDSKPWFICVVYVPTGHSNTILNDAEELLESITLEAILFAQQGSIVVLGDFNSHPIDGLGPKSENEPGDTTSQRLLDLSQRLDLVAANLLDSCKGYWTWSQGILRSVNDYIFIPTISTINVAEASVQEDLDVQSDHCLLTCSIKVTPSADRPTPSKEFVYRWKRLENDRNLQFELDKALQLSLQTVSNDLDLLLADFEANKITADSLVNSGANLLSLAILYPFDQILGGDWVKPGIRRSWWNQACETAFHQRQAAFRTRHAARTLLEAQAIDQDAMDEVDRTYKAARSKFSKTRKMAQKSDWQNLLSPILHVNASASRELSRKITRILKKPQRLPAYITYKDNPIASSAKEKSNLFAKAFEELYCTPPSNSSATPVSNWLIEQDVSKATNATNHRPELDGDLTIEEMTIAFKTTSKGKAGPSADVSSRMLEFCSHHVIPVITKLSNICLKVEKIPDLWKYGEICPLVKPSANPHDALNFRGITLLSLLGKWMDKALSFRLRKWMDTNGKLSKLQAGFRSNHSTTDWIWTLNEVLDHCRENNLPLYAAFVDVKKAFDTVWLTGLWYKMIQLGIDGKLLRIYQDWYTNRVSTVKVQGEKSSNSFSSTQGVAQGGISSPTFYAIFVDDLSKELEAQGLGFQLGELVLAILLYADDMILLARSPEELQRMLDILQEFSTKWHFDVNTAKTKVMTFNTQFRRHQWTFLGQPLEEVESFPYLGVTISRSSMPRLKWNLAMEKLIARGRNVTNSVFRSCFADHPEWNVGMASNLFLTYVNSSVMTGAEVLDPAPTWLEKLDVIQRKAGRHFMRVQRSANNCSVYGVLGWLPISHQFDQRKLTYLGKIHQLPPDHLVSQVFQERYGTMVPAGSWLDRTHKLLNAHSVQPGLESLTPYNMWKHYVRTIIIQDYTRQYWLLSKNSPKTQRLNRTHPCPNAIKHLLNGPNKAGTLIKLKLLIGVNPLEIDRLRRFGIPREERFCSLCNLEVGDETHFVTTCPTLLQERTEMLSSILTTFNSLNCLSQKSEFLQMSREHQCDTLLGFAPTTWPNKLKLEIYKISDIGLVSMFQIYKDKAL